MHAGFTVSGFVVCTPVRTHSDLAAGLAAGLSVLLRDVRSAAGRSVGHEKALTMPSLRNTAASDRIDGGEHVDHGLPLAVLRSHRVAKSRASQKKVVEAAENACRWGTAAGSCDQATLPLKASQAISLIT